MEDPVGGGGLASAASATCAPVLKEEDFHLEEFILKLRSVGWCLGEAGDKGRGASFLISCLQHFSGKYNTRVTLDEMVSSSGVTSADWHELTKDIDGSHHATQFLHRVLPFLYDGTTSLYETVCLCSFCTSRLEPPETQLVKILREYFDSEVEGQPSKVAPILIDMPKSYALIKLPSEELQSYLSVRKNSLLLFRDYEGTYAPILPRALLHPDPTEYGDVLIAELDENQLLATCFHNWLHDFHSRGADSVQVYRAVQEMLDAVLASTRVESVTHAMVQLCGAAVGAVYPLMYLPGVMACMSSPEQREACLHDLKQEVSGALFRTVKGYNLELQVQARVKGCQHQRIKKDLEEQAARIWKQHAQEILRLKNLNPDQRLDYATIKDNPSTKFAALIQLYQSSSWTKFKACLLTVNPSSSFKDLQVPFRRSLSDVYTKLLSCFNLRDSKFPGLRDRLSKNRDEDRANLEQVIGQVSVFKTTYWEEKATVLCSGTHVRLSMALSQVREFLRWKGRRVDEIQIIGSGTVWLDEDIKEAVGHGRNVYIYGDAVKIEKPIRICCSGRDGRPTPRKPDKPSGFGINGIAGERGEDGESAGNVRIESLQPIMMNELSQLHILCNGGHGSDGQNGGDGSNGKDGRAGADGQISSAPPNQRRHLVFKRGETGQVGQNGGDAGPPGLGGSGGAGGIIQIISGSQRFELKPQEEHASQTHQHLPNLSTVNGRCGNTGKVGDAGEGGEGGKPGRDRAWARERRFQTWRSYEGFLEAVKCTGIIDRGYKIRLETSRPAAAPGNHGQDNKAQRIAQQRTLSIMSRKREVNTALSDPVKTRSSEENTWLRGEAITAGEAALARELKNVKDALNCETFEQQLRVEAVSGILATIDSKMKQVEEEAVEIQEEEKKSVDVLAWFQQLEKKTVNRLDLAISQLVEARMSAAEAVGIQIATPTPFMPLDVDIPLPSPSHEEERLGAMWSACALQRVCECMDTELREILDKVRSKLEARFGDGGLNRALERCIQRLIIFFEWTRPPDDVLDTIDHLIDLTTSPDEVLGVGHLLTTQDLDEILLDKLPKYASVVYDTKGTRRGSWDEWLPLPKDVGMSVLRHIFHLQLEEIDEKKLQPFETILFGGDQRRSVQLSATTSECSVLFDIFSAQLLMQLRRGLEKREQQGAGGPDLFRRKFVALARRMVQTTDGVPAGMEQPVAQHQDLVSEQDKNSFVAMVKVDVLPALWKLLNVQGFDPWRASRPGETHISNVQLFDLWRVSRPGETNISNVHGTGGASETRTSLQKCVEAILKHVGKGNDILEGVLASMTKVRYQDILGALSSSPERAFTPLHSFLLMSYVKHEARLDELQTALNHTRFQPESLTLVTWRNLLEQIYQDNFKTPLQEQIEKYLEDVEPSGGWRKVLEDFVGLIECEKGRLEYKYKIEKYRLTLTNISQLRLAGATERTSVIEAELESVFNEALCGRLLSLVGDHQPDVIDMNQFQIFLPEAIKQMKANLKPLSDPANQQTTIVQLRSIGLLLKFVPCQSGKDLRRVEAAFENLVRDRHQGFHNLRGQQRTLLVEAIKDVESLLASGWRKHTIWLVQQFRDRYDHEALDLQKQEILQKIYWYVDILVTDSKILRPGLVADRLEAKVELLVYFSLQFGDRKAIRNVAVKLQELSRSTWESAADLVRQLADILDTEIQQTFRAKIHQEMDDMKRQLERNWSGAGGMGLSPVAAFAELIADPQNVTKYVQVLKKHCECMALFRANASVNASERGGGGLEFQAVLVRHLVKWAIWNFPALALSGDTTGPGADPAKFKGQEGNFRSLEQEIKFFGVEALKLLQLLKAGFLGRADLLIDFLREGVDVQAEEVVVAVATFRRLTEQRLLELEECRDVCDQTMKGTLSDGRYKYLSQIQQTILKSSSSTIIGNLEEVEGQAWIKAGGGDRGRADSLWLFRFLQQQLVTSTSPSKGAEDMRYLPSRLMTFSLNMLRTNQGINSSPASGAFTLVQSLIEGFQHLPGIWGDKKSCHRQVDTWIQIHSRLMAYNSAGALDETERRTEEKGIWDIVYSSDQLFCELAENSNRNLRFFNSLCRLYFRPGLPPPTRQLILRICNALRQSTSKEYMTILLREAKMTKKHFLEEFLAALNEKGTPVEAIASKLVDFTLSCASTAKFLFNKHETTYYEAGTQSTGQGKRLEFPLHALSEECPSRWKDFVLANYYVCALLSNLNLNPRQNAAVQVKFSDSLCRWHSAVVSTAAGTSALSLGIRKWTQVVRKIVYGCRVHPVTYEQLNTCFLNAARASECDVSQDDVDEVISQRSSASWSRALYFLLLKGKLLQLYGGGGGDDGSNRATRALTRLEDYLTSPGVTISPPDVLDKILDTLLQKLAGRNAAVRDLAAMESIFLAVEKQSIIDEMTLEALKDLSLSGWEEGLRRCAYKRRGIEDEGTVRRCLQVEKRFCNTTEEFVEIVWKYEPTCLLQYLDKIVSGEWVLSKKFLEGLRERVHGGVGADFSRILAMEMKAAMPRNGGFAGDELVDAFCDLAMNKNICAKNLKAKDLAEDLRQIEQAMCGTSRILKVREKVEKWERKEIGAWVAAVRKLRDRASAFDLCKAYKREFLAVINRGVCVVRKHPILDTQLLAVLCFLSSWESGDGSKGRFGEIATSEGKTLISCVLAIHLSLGGHNGNIVSSSPILAVNGAKEMKGLYELFGVQMANICDDSCKRGSGNSEQELKRRYASQVIYSDVGSLQSDFLQNYNLGSTYAKNNRQVSYMIVDEVDSMLLDKGSHVLFLSRTIPELRHLKQIFIDIWAQVNNSHADRKRDSEALLGEMQKSVLSNRVPYSHFLQKFILERLPVWINHAYNAVQMKRNYDFVVTNKVTIVDLPTGVEQMSTQYCFGLHQFLQLKYGKKLTPERLKDNFISNMGYFKLRVDRTEDFKLFGLTGTMGGEESLQLLHDIYDVDFFKIPRKKIKKCVRYPAVIKATEQEQLEAIASSVKEKMRDQPILIICANVHDAQAVASCLRSKPFIRQAHPRHGILMASSWRHLFEYTSSANDDDFCKVFNKDTPCTAQDVIISTNLAGRGTDLPVDPNCGSGLHVILASVPPNERVEKQAFGRTSRQGNPGTTEYIVRQLPGARMHSIDAYRQLLDKLESGRLAHFRAVQAPQIELEEQLFDRFKTCYDVLMNNEKLWAKRSWSDRRRTKTTQKVYGDLVKNRWAFWLDEVETLVHLNRREQLDKKFDLFWKDIQDRAKQDFALCMSAADYVKLARALEEEENPEDAITVLLHAIEEESYYNEIAHYYLGVCLLKLDAQTKGPINKVAGRTTKSFATRWLARHHLKEAQTRINRNCRNLEMMLEDINFNELARALPEASSGEASAKDFLLEVQIKNELELYEQHLRVLNELLGTRVDVYVLKLVSGIDRNAEEAGQVLNTILDVDQQLLTQRGSGEKHERILKPLRLSRKVRLTQGEDGSEILLVGGQQLEWAETLTDFAPRIMQCIKEIQQRCNRRVGSPLAKGNTSSLEVVVPLCYNLYDKKGMQEHIAANVLLRPKNTNFITPQDFTRLFPTKQELWKMIAGVEGFLQSSSQSTDLVVKFCDQRFGKLREASKSRGGVGWCLSSGLSLLVAPILKEHNLCVYGDEIRRKMQAELDATTQISSQHLLTINELEGLLTSAGLLVREVNYEGTISVLAFAQLKVYRAAEADVYRLSGLPEALLAVHHLLEYMIIPQTPVDAEVPRKRQTIATSSLKHKLPFDAEELCRENVLSQLIEDGIVKPCAVDWQLAERFNAEEARSVQIERCFKSSIASPDRIVAAGVEGGGGSGVVRRAKESVLSGLAKLTPAEHKLCAELRAIFRKRHPIELEESRFATYLQNICKGLLRSVGSIKTLSQLDVAKKYNSICDAFALNDKTFQLPSSNLEEILDLCAADFERMPAVGRKRRWWSVGSTSVAVLGLCQIALAILLAWMTVGIGFQVYTTLIVEGVSDIVYAVETGVTDSFTWKSYALHKCISMFTTGVGGISARAAVGVSGKALKRVTWILGRYGIEYVGGKLLGASIDKILTTMEESILTNFQDLLTRLLCGKKFQSVMKDLRNVLLTELYQASFEAQQAEMIIHESWNVRLRGSAFAHKLEAEIYAVSRVVIRKACDKISQRCGRYGVTVQLAGSLLSSLGLARLVTKRPILTVTNFAMHQVQALVAHFKHETQNLAARAAARGGRDRPQRSDRVEYEEYVEEYARQVQNHFVTESVRYFREEVCGPKLKEWANMYLQKQVDSVFLKKQFEFRLKVREAGARARQPRAGLSAVLKLQPGPSVALAVPWSEFVDRQQRSNTWSKIDTRIQLSNSSRKETVGGAVQSFGGSVILIKSSSKRRPRPTNTTAAQSSSVSAVFIVDTESAHLRDKATELGIPVIRKIHLV